MNSAGLPRLLRTVRHLRPSQLAWRCRYLAERKWRTPRPALPPPERCRAPAVGIDFPAVPVFHRPGVSGTELVDELERGHFTHLRRTVEIGRAQPDWQLGRVDANRLWTITLHYHAWAHAAAEIAAGGGPQAERAAELLAAYLSDWIERCEVGAEGARDLAWNSFAIATRLSWWIRTWLLLGTRRPAAWTAIAPRVLESMWQQAAWLHDHLEWDLRGNHLLRDLTGLAWAGRFFTGRDAERWSATAATRVPGQLAEQILPDGGHFERSPMYHVHAMEDVLALALLLQPHDVVGELKNAWQRMAHYLVWMRHPDGFVPLLNDGGLHAVCEPATMLDLGRTLGLEVDTDLPAGGSHFPDCGVVVWHGDPWSVFFDVGEIGAEVVPGHGHADTLTFECSFRGRRLVVDPGSFAYDNDARRRADRSTAAHNTVCVDDVDSSEVWHIFRVGRRARPADVRVSFATDGFEASAHHTGYGKVVHRRRIAANDDGALVIEDTLEGPGEHRASGGLLLDPAWSAEPAESGWLLRRDASRVRVRLRAQGARPELGRIEAPYHPDYGVEHMTRRLVWSARARFPLSVRTEIAEA